jgi:oligosaccharide translocation protein RFT1
MSQDWFHIFLTRGDVPIIAAIASLSDFGLYKLASTYSEFIANLSFHRLNHPVRKQFARLHTPAKVLNEGESNGLAHFARIRLQAILQIYSVFGVVAITTGPTLAPMLVRIIAGSNWANSGAGSVVSSYCYYIPLIAIDGLMESFVVSVATHSELATENKCMATSLLVFACTAYTFVKILGQGANGIVYASCVRTLFHISCRYYFCARYLKRRGQVSTLQDSHMLPCSFYYRPLIFLRLYHVLGRFYWQLAT